MRIRHFNFVVFLFSLGMFFASCGEHYYFNESIELNNKEWLDNKSYDFAFQIVDTTQLFDMYFDVEHNTDYDYQNLYIRIDTRYPNNQINADTLSFDLAAKSGSWNGKCSGDHCSLRVFLAHKIRFEQNGNYQISFSQYSRYKSVSHIESLSLKLKEIE